MHQGCRSRAVRRWVRFAAGSAGLVPALVACLAAADPPPKVVAAWASGPFETRLAFDRAVDPGLARSAVGRSIAFDETRPNVRSPAPTVRPPDTRGRLNVAAARLDDGGRTLVLTTDPHPRAGTYSVELAQTLTTYDLTGVEAVWDDGGDEARPVGTTWWPSLDPEDARTLARHLPALATSLGRLDRPGRLTLSTLLTLPEGPATVRVSGNVPIEPTLGGEGPAAREAGGDAVFPVESTGEPLPLVLTVRTGTKPAGGLARWRVTTRVEGSAEDRPVDRSALLAPWVPLAPPPPSPLQDPPNLEGGDPTRGAAVFASAEAKCSSCHRVRGQGAEVGPDLSTLVGRDRLEVYRDIAEPSARVHPDFVPYTVALKDGRVLVGTVRAQGAGALVVTDTEAKAVVVPRAEVEDVRPSATSIMPVGLAGAIGEARLRDLVAFLTAPGPAAGIKGSGP